MRTARPSSCAEYPCRQALEHDEGRPPDTTGLIDEEETSSDLAWREHRADGHGDLPATVPRGPMTAVGLAALAGYVVSQVALVLLTSR